ncbi:MAG TPA: DUF2914 domain-containing protein [Kofleriaceae bacterium]|nr:DUF2914 domain-containing protein [Kofleriaceae bacterium]
MKNWYRYCIVALMLATGVASADDAKPTDKPAEAKPAPPKQEPAGASAEVKAGTAIEKHEIVGEASTFAAGTTVWVWSRITNGQGTIKHVWKLDGKEVWTATLPVGSARWSTMTRRTIGAKGAWEVDVQTEGGASIGSVSFKVE